MFPSWLVVNSLRCILFQISQRCVPVCLPRTNHWRRYFKKVCERKKSFFSLQKVYPWLRWSDQPFPSSASHNYFQGYRRDCAEFHQRAVIWKDQFRLKSLHPSRRSASFKLDQSGAKDNQRICLEVLSPERKWSYSLWETLVIRQQFCQKSLNILPESYCQRRPYTI